MIGIGIDTGGTYTDAVIYDFDHKKVLASGKSLTTKSRLTVGIRNALELLPDKFIAQAGLLSLSTTLATNACVEGIGGRAKLVFIGVEKKTVEEFYQSYGLPSPAEICFLEKPVKDWEAFREEVKSTFGEYESVAIVEIFAQNDQGQYEKEAKKIIQEVCDLPCVLGYELFHELNVLRRGASVLLNARLMPVINRFLDSIQQVLKEKGLDLPIVIVRSDGSLMSLEYTLKHPVDTLLCGPASSIIAGTELTREENALIVDMGGTTTDVAIVRNRLPVTIRSGISIGQWKTFVKGLYVDTFGLGGDSAIRYKDRHLILDPVRVIPLCHLASQYPQILQDLQELLATHESPHVMYLHEFFVLLQDIEGNPSFTDAEKAFCRALRDRPLIMEKAAAAIGKDVYCLKVTERLEREGIIMRSGLTPTDIMHLKGDFRRYDSEASRLGGIYLAMCTGTELHDLCDHAYALIKKKLYCNLARIVLKYEHPFYEKYEDHKLFTRLIEDAYETAVSTGTNFGRLSITTDAVLVGIGAPTHIFLEDVAKMLGTHAVIPPHAPVANALGAALGNVSVLYPVEIKPLYDGGGITGYQICSHKGPLYFETLEEAQAAAIKEAEDGARQKALERGALETELSHEISSVSPVIQDSPMLLSMTVTGKAFGKIHLCAKNISR